MTTHDEDPIFSLAFGKGAVYLARQSGIYSSRDNGRSWQQVWSEAFPTCVALFESPQLLVAGVPGGIARSSDGGESWQVASLGDPPPVVVAITANADGAMLAATMEDGIFRSIDGGISWQSANVGIWLPRMTAILALDAETVVAATEAGPVYSSNGGLSWEDALATEYPVSALAGSDELIVAGGESGELFLSRSGGVSWTRTSIDLAGSPILELNLWGNAIAILTSDGLFRGVISDSDEIESLEHLKSGEFVAGSIGVDGSTVLVHADGSFQVVAIDLQGEGNAASEVSL